MKQVILDTSFILSCVKQKIDFMEDLKNMGLSILIPMQVFVELEGKAKSIKTAELGLTILKNTNFQKIDLKTKNVDEGLIAYGKKNKDVFIATLDREIKKKGDNSNIVIRQKKRLEVI